jgi:hypothetical protein
MGTPERRPGIDVRGLSLVPEVGTSGATERMMTMRDSSLLCAIALTIGAAACGASAKAGFNQDDGGNVNATTAPSPANADAGIACGAQGGCAEPQVCCYGAAAGPLAPPPAPSCTPQGSCAGSSLACSGTAHCSGSQVCCFAFDMADAGQQGDGGRGFPTIGAQGFNAECADQCPTGDMVHYQLCSSASDCPTGQSCVRGMYTTYCAAMGAGPGGGGNGGGFPGFPFRDAGLASD